MRRVALVDYGKLELQDNCSAVQALQPGTVKVDVHACAICGSDLALYRGQRSLKDERYFGHEFSGVVTDAGAGAGGIKNGMRVGSELSRTCGRCWNCLNGMQNYCRSMNDALLPGGFSEETLVLNTEDYSFLSPIPDELDFETAALLEPTNCAYRIASKAALVPGSSVVVFGLGAMGLISALILKSFGAGTIVGVDRSKERLAKVQSLGFMEVVDSSDDKWLDKVHALTSQHGADVVIEATGAVPVLGSAFEAVRPGGRIVVGSVYHADAGALKLLPIMRKEITIAGAKGPYPQLLSDGTSAPVRILTKLQPELKALVSVYDYKDALQAFEDALSGRAVKAVVRFK
ncbi:MAG: alcohol dehydrogenase catalytic domain-containing protein [Proteobacteria bacterium]|uniref:Alcohol dehydrogenase catalytic domain-containing protein n=1 Tax=Candidatus Avisuccinivibrio stercorigallinarum TaxID=2840704 RepID=A0A9D9GTD6_9GAMM|nr:alcohol dehydrogenase catalytic domain-containing protein [Candidatus Avisuccinivibrio stercorigallinarum]